MPPNPDVAWVSSTLSVPQGFLHPVKKKAQKRPDVQEKNSCRRDARPNCPGRNDSRKGGGANWYFSIRKEQKRNVFYNYAAKSALSRSYNEKIPLVKKMLAKNGGFLSRICVVVQCKVAVLTKYINHIPSIYHQYSFCISLVYHLYIITQERSLKHKFGPELAHT